MSRFLACATTQAWTGCPVAPRTRTRRVPCSITARTFTRASWLNSPAGPGSRGAKPVRAADPAPLHQPQRSMRPHTGDGRALRLSLSEEPLIAALPDISLYWSPRFPRNPDFLPKFLPELSLAPESAPPNALYLSLIHISEPTRLGMI